MVGTVPDNMDDAGDRISAMYVYECCWAAELACFKQRIGHYVAVELQKRPNLRQDVV